MTMIILLRHDDPGLAALWYDEATGGEGSDTPLEVLAGKAAADPKMQVCLALAGEMAVSRSFRLPMKRERDARRAVDLLIDDMLASPIADRVVALGEARHGQRLAVALPAEAISDALAAANAAGIDPDILTVDHALLPVAEEGAVTAFRIGSRVAIRTSEGAFTDEAAFAEGLFNDLGRDPLREVQLSDLDAEGLPNFRTGRFARRRKLPDLRPFAAAASLLLVAGMIFLASSLVEGIRYAGAASDLRQQAEEGFLRAFPGTPVVDIERQIRGGAGVAQRSVFLPLSAILAELIAEQDTTTLSSLTYTAGGELTAELTVVSIADLEAITGALEARGVSVEEGGDVRREDGALLARLFLRAV